MRHLRRLRLAALPLLTLVALAATASAEVAVSHRDTSAPSVAVSFPVASASYGDSAWMAGCRPHGVCGTAKDASGVNSVQVSLERLSNGRYWRKGGFRSLKASYSYAVLDSRGKSVRWHRWLPQLPDGQYLLKVIATDRHGNKTHASGVIKVGFSIDSAAPPAPTFTALPSTAADSSISFTDSESGVSFQCSLDGADSSSCQPPVALHALASGGHSFCAVAVDAAANRSQPACHSWQVSAAPTEKADFSIAGKATAPLLPGGPDSPIDLVLTNPHSGDIVVDSVTVSISSLTGAKGACALNGNFTVSRQLNGPLTVPSGSHSLSQLGLAQSRWPALRMLDNGLQDGCQGATLSLSYSGSAH